MFNLHHLALNVTEEFQFPVVCAVCLSILDVSTTIALL